MSQAKQSAVWLLLLSFILRVAAHSFPYVPTQVLMSTPCYNESNCDARDVAYIFIQTGDNDSDIQLLRLNYTSSIDDKTQLDTVTSDLPFLGGDDKSTAFTAVRTANGTLVVYAGRCDEGSGQIWSYNEADGGVWRQRQTQDDENGDTARGPYYLGGTLAFSSTLAPSMDEPTIYTYGGMCAKPSTDSKDWQSDGNYTKTMMSLKPDDQTQDTGYTLSVASVSGPRTPIAGFSLTPLTPSMTNLSGAVTQQASYVVLGGHTQEAFINMSTAAVWNLPEESWTYVSVLAPSDNAGTELAIKDITPRSNPLHRRATDNVYSRSGHTAVLTEDGASIVILGGWVGDIDTPAEPQFAILDLTQAYSQWQWRVPYEQPLWNGKYGHGAAMLPGNVMVVYGGWDIESSSSKTKRQSQNMTPQFLNLTSMTWTTSYTNPNKASSGSEAGKDAPGKGNDSSNTKKVGLGLGLGLGLAFLLAIIIAVLLFLWRRRRSGDKRSRDNAVRALSQDAGRFLNDHDEMVERDDYVPWGNSGWYTGGHDRYQQSERSLGYESLRGSHGSGGYDNIPPITGIARKSVARPMRGGYIAAPPRPGSFSTTPGRIHPILEDDEEEMGHRQDPHTPTSEVPSDPFQTPTTLMAPPVFFAPIRHTRTPSPEHIPRHDPEVQDWVSDVDAAEGMLARMNTRHGRISPTRRNSRRSAASRDDESRSGSNLSEASLRRSPSGRKSALGAMSSGLFGGSTLLGAASVEPVKPGSSSSSSYNTAKSAFGTLQAEGPSLLLGRQTPSSPTYDDNDDNGGNDMRNPPGSPSKSKPPRRSWLGSLRRVFSTSGRTTSSATSSRPDSARRASLDMGFGDYEPPLVGLSGELLRRKQGRHDWEDDAGGSGSGLGKAFRYNSLTGEQQREGETDWDIERAVEQRLVQVMFTVPRERLRVVNADNEIPDDESFVQGQAAELVNPENAPLKRISTPTPLLQQPSPPSPPTSPTTAATTTHLPMPPTSIPPPSPSPLSSRASRSQLELFPPSPDLEPLRIHQYETRAPLLHRGTVSSEEVHRSLLPLPATDPDADVEHASLLAVDDSLSRRLSHSSAGSGLSAAVMQQAEAMTMHRPKTKVLTMVDHFETKSREPSPGSSPKR